MIDTETIADKVVLQIQDLGKKVDALLHEKASLQFDLDKLKHEREAIRKEIDSYLKELEQLKEQCNVGSNNSN